MVHSLQTQIDKLKLHNLYTGVKSGFIKAGITNMIHLGDLWTVVFEEI